MRTAFLSLMLCTFTFVFTGCDDASDGTTSQQKIENAADKTGDALQRGAEKTGEALNRAAEGTGRVINNVSEKVRSVDVDVNVSTRPTATTTRAAP